MLTKRDIQAIKSLLKFAKTIQHTLHPREMHFALGVYRKQCVYGHNDYTPKGEFQEFHKYCTPHAESSVLKHMPKVHALYVVRINAAGEFLLSTPCQECMQIIRSKKVRNLVFSIDKGLKKMVL